MVLRLYPTLLSSLLLWSTTHAAPARTLSLEERLGRLENEVTSLREENSALKNRLGIESKRGTSAETIVHAAGKETRLAIGGFIHLNGEFGDSPDDRWSGTNARDRFLIRRARLGVQGQWKEPVSFKLEADFGNNSLSGKSGYSAQITDVYATYSSSRAFNVRLGQFKTPFGYEQLTSDTKVLTIERSLPNDRLTVGRQVGLGVFGEILEGKLTYSTGVFNGNGANNGLNDNDNFLSAARISGSLIKTKFQDKMIALNVGANGYLNKSDTTTLTTEREGWGFDAQLTVGSLNLTAEILGLSTQTRTQPTIDSVGWNIFAVWDLPTASALSMVARFENYEANTAIPDSRSENVVLGMIYRLKGDDLRLSINYILGNPAGPLSRQGRLLTGAQLIY